jgi:hypothetical protein
MIRFAYMYLLNQKTYTSNVIASTLKSTLHYFFLTKLLIFICLVGHFLFKLNNKLSILTTFPWSLTMLQAGSIPDEVTGFSIDLILPAALWPWGRLSL